MIVGHKKQWNFLKEKFESEKLGHAYLFVGAEQLGKKSLAKEFVKLINCTRDIRKKLEEMFNSKNLKYLLIT